MYLGHYTLYITHCHALIYKEPTLYIKCLNYIQLCEIAGIFRKHTLKVYHCFNIHVCFELYSCTLVIIIKVTFTVVFFNWPLRHSIHCGWGEAGKPSTIGDTRNGQPIHLQTRKMCRVWPTCWIPFQCRGPGNLTGIAQVLKKLYPLSDLIVTSVLVRFCLLLILLPISFTCQTFKHFKMACSLHFYLKDFTKVLLMCWRLK